MQTTLFNKSSAATDYEPDFETEFFLKGKNEIRTIEDISKIFASSNPYNLKINICGDYQTPSYDDLPLVIESMIVEVCRNKKQSGIEVLPEILTMMNTAFPLAVLNKSRIKKNTLKLTYSVDIEERENYYSIDDLLESEINFKHDEISQFISRNSIEYFQLVVNIRRL